VACAVCGIPDDFGAVFTRWGNVECPASSQKIYSGAVANAHHGHNGGGANSICLTDKPTEAPDNQGGNQNHGMLYGMEYQSTYAGVDHNDWDAGCAVCAYEGLTTYIPWGTTECQDGHVKLYDGNVMAGHHNHQKNNYACVDPERAEHAMATDRGNTDQALWYLAEFECGSLPCSLYPAQKEAACAVCGIPGLEGTGVTMSCAGYDSEATCPRGQCMWVGHACQTDCLEFRSNTSCPAQCLWDDDTALCQTPCEDFSTLDECPPGRCWWRAGTCTSFSSSVAGLDVDEDGFVLLLKDFHYYGVAMPDLAEPLAYGQFDMIKAVYKSGHIACNTGHNGPRKWQVCSNGNDNTASFELKKNSDWVVRQSNWHTLPSECDLPTDPKTIGPILCTVDFSLDKGDRILASWYEPTHQTSLSDNGGEIVVDIRARLVT